MPSESDAARDRPHLYLVQRWGPVAPELVRLAHLLGRAFRLMDGIPGPEFTREPLKADDARRAWRHLGEALDVLRGHLPETHERRIREVFEWLGRYRPPPGRRSTERAEFAREMRERLAGRRLAREKERAGQHERSRLTTDVDWRDLMALARIAGIERCDDDALDVDREWRRLCPENPRSQR